MPAKHDLSSLRLLGSVGEPINPEAWMWYHGSHRRRALPDRRHLVADRDRRHHDLAAAGRHRRPSPAAHPSRCPASRPRSSTTTGTHGAAAASGGYLVLTEPWPAMLRGIWGDHERYIETYWAKFGTQCYFSGDGAKRDEDGYFWIWAASTTC